MHIVVHGHDDLGPRETWQAAQLMSRRLFIVAYADPYKVDVCSQ